jgi:hypothetical protein
VIEREPHAGSRTTHLCVHVVGVIVRTVLGGELLEDHVREEHPVAGAGVGVVVAAGRRHEGNVGVPKVIGVEGAAVRHDAPHQDPGDRHLQRVLARPESRVVMDALVGTPEVPFPVIDDIPDDGDGGSSRVPLAPPSTIEVRLVHDAPRQFTVGFRVSSHFMTVLVNDLPSSAVVPMSGTCQRVPG